MRIKPYLAAILVTGVIFSSAAGLLAPRPAKALVFPTSEVPASPLILLLEFHLTTQTAVQSAHYGQNLYEWSMTFVLEMLKKRILDLLVDEIIQWIQGGGQPRFVTDWQGFLVQAGNIAAGDFAKELGAGFLCQPFSAQVQAALGLSQNPVPRFTPPYACTLDKIVGNVNNFYNNFSQGGWPAYQSAWRMENNVFGSYVIAHSELQKRISAAQQAAQNQALAGRGFLSTMSCESSPLATAVARSQKNGQNLDAFKTGKWGPDLDGNGTPDDVASSCRVTTPGSVIGDVVSKAVGSDIDFIVNAQQLQAYVAAIANAAINRLVREGTSGLLGILTPAAPTGTNGSISSGSGKCGGLSGEAKTACDSYSSAVSSGSGGGSTTPLDPENIDSSLTPRIAAQTALNDSLTQEQGLVDKLQTKPNCAKPDTEIDDRLAIIVGLKTRIMDNQKAIDALNVAKTQAANVKKGSAKYWKIVNTVLTYLNPVQAETFQKNAEDENTQIRAEVSARLTEVNACSL